MWVGRAEEFATGVRNFRLADYTVSGREAGHSFAEMTCLRQLVTRALLLPFTPHRKHGLADSDFCSH